MKTDIFNNQWQYAKQKEIATYFLARLRSLEQADYPCNDYPSACSLARILQQVDRERLIQSVHIHRTYVRIHRNPKGAFAFAAVVLDHVSTSVGVSEGSNRP